MPYTNFKPTIWSKFILRELEKKLIFWDLCNHQYEGEVRHGEKVRVVSPTRPTIGDYKVGTNINSPEEMDGLEQLLEITEAKYFNFMVDDIDKAQSIKGMMEAYMGEATDALASVRDEFVAKTAAQGSVLNQITQTISSEDDMKKVIDEGLVKLWEGNVPISEQVSIVMPPKYYDLFKSSMQALYTDNVDLIRKGIVGRYSGAEVRMSNSIFNDGTHDNILVMTRKAVAVAGQINQTEAYRPEGRFADAVKGLDVYGAKVVRPKEIAVLKLNIT